MRVWCCGAALIACASWQSAMAQTIIAVNPTSNQVNAVTSGMPSAETVTVKLFNHTIFPGEVDTAAPTSSTNVFVLTPPTTPNTCPVLGSGISGSLCNSFGILNFYNVSAAPEEVLTNGGASTAINTQILTVGTQNNWAFPSLATVDVSGNLATNGGNVNTGAGTTTTHQLVVSSTSTNGEWIPCIAGSTANCITVTPPPQLAVAEGGVLPDLGNGSVGAVLIPNNGTYTNCTAVTFAFSGTGGAAASGTCTTGGYVTPTLTNGGSGYSAAPTVTMTCTISTGAACTGSPFTVTALMGGQYAGFQGVPPTSGLVSACAGGRGCLQSSISADVRTLLGYTPAAIMFGNLSGATIASGSTVYLLPGVGTTSSTEPPRQAPMPKAGIVTNMCVTTSTAQGSGGSLTFTLDDGGTATALTVVFLAGTGASTICAVYPGQSNYPAGTSNINVALGDLLSIKAVNAGGAATGVYGFSWEIE